MLEFDERTKKEQFLRKVELLRDWQKKYFNEKEKGQLEICKSLEKEIDEILSTLDLDLLVKVAWMRNQQKEYFLNRTDKNLKESKFHESKVDLKILQS